MPLEQFQIVEFLSRLHFFAGIDPERMKFVAQRFTEHRFSAETTVYAQGDDSNLLYFIYEGRVELTRVARASTEKQTLGDLDAGDYFGLEILEANEPRQATAIAQTNVILLSVDVKGLNEIADHVPEMVARFEMAIRSFHLALRTRLEWVNPAEFVHYITRKHPIILWGRLVPLVLFMLVAFSALTALYLAMPLAIVLVILVGTVVASLGLGVWIYIDWSNDYYIVTSRRVVFQERVVLLYDSRQESPMEQVQSTETERSYLGRLIGYGDVRIRTYTGLILFEAVKYPKEIEAIIFEQLKRAQSSLRQAEMRDMEEIIARRIGLLPPKPAPAPPARPESPSPIQRLLSDLFHLRYEYGDTIQYRTHWFVLVRRIWFVTLLLLATIVGGLVLLSQSALGRLGEGFPVVGAFLGLCLLGLIFFLRWLYVFFDWHNDLYLITSDQIVDIYRKPLGKEEKNQAPIRNILSVEYKRIGIIGLLLNYGTVYIRVGDQQFTFDEVFNPSEVQRELFHRMAERTLRERRQQAENERQRMADWLSAYHRLTK